MLEVWTPFFSSLQSGICELGSFIQENLCFYTRTCKNPFNLEMHVAKKALLLRQNSWAKEKIVKKIPFILHAKKNDLFRIIKDFFDWWLLPWIISSRILHFWMWSSVPWWICWCLLQSLAWLKGFLPFWILITCHAILKL